MIKTPRTDAELDRLNSEIRRGEETEDMAEVRAWGVARELEEENIVLIALLREAHNAYRAAQGDRLHHIMADVRDLLKANDGVYES